MQGKAIVKDGVSLTTYNDPRQTKSTFLALQKAGKKCEMKEDVIVEYYDGLKAAEISKIIEKNIKDLSEKMQRYMKINYNIQHFK